MRVFDFLGLMEPTIAPDEAKIHLATWNGHENPLDVYFSGKFPEWQQWQTRKNFEKRLVISLIALPTPNKWLFCGAYTVAGYKEKKNTKFSPDISYYYYQLNEIPSCAQMNGRLVAHFERAGRQSYLLAENWVDKILLSEILAERLRVAEFPGYRAIDLSKENLDIITSQAIESWKAALSSVAGVYLISDTKSGKLYVGSASGEGGIWQRWLNYSANGHGGNVKLKQLLQSEGDDRSSHFHFSILEIADLHESQESILQRESHWMSVLLSREHGLN
jgi:hypothetical protein